MEFLSGPAPRSSTPRHTAVLKDGRGRLARGSAQWPKLVRGAQAGARARRSQKSSCYCTPSGVPSLQPRLSVRTLRASLGQIRWERADLQRALFHSAGAPTALASGRDGYLDRETSVLVRQPATTGRHDRHNNQLRLPLHKPPFSFPPFFSIHHYTQPQHAGGPSGNKIIAPGADLIRDYCPTSPLPLLTPLPHAYSVAAPTLPSGAPGAAVQCSLRALQYHTRHHGELNRT